MRFTVYFSLCNLKSKKMYANVDNYVTQKEQPILPFWKYFIKPVFKYDDTMYS